MTKNVGHLEGSPEPDPKGEDFRISTILLINRKKHHVCFICNTMGIETTYSLGRDYAIGNLDYYRSQNFEILLRFFDSVE